MSDEQREIEELREELRTEEQTSTALRRELDRVRGLLADEAKGKSGGVA